MPGKAGPGSRSCSPCLVLAWCRAAYAAAVCLPPSGRCCGRGEGGEGLAAPAAGFRGEPGCGAAGAVVLAGVPGGGDALVADDEKAGGEQQDRRESRQAAPAAADVVAGGVLDGAEGAFGAGAAVAGAPVCPGGAVVFLRGPGRHLGRDGDGLLVAAGRRMLRGCQDLRPRPVRGHRLWPEGAAYLAHGGGAHDPVVAVFVISGGPAGLVAGEPGGLSIVRGDLLAGGVAGQGAESGQGAGSGGAVQAAVGDDGAVVGAVGSAVVGVQVLDEGGAGRAQRQGPVPRGAAGVSGAGEDVAGRDALSGQPGQDGDEPGDEPGDGVVAAGGEGDAAGQFRGREGRLRRASWWQLAGSSRRTARLRGRAGCCGGAPGTLRGRRGRRPWPGEGGERVVHPGQVGRPVIG